MVRPVGNAHRVVTCQAGRSALSVKVRQFDFFSDFFTIFVLFRLGNQILQLRQQRIHCLTIRGSSLSVRFISLLLRAAHTQRFSRNK